MCKLFIPARRCGFCHTFIEKDCSDGVTYSFMLISCGTMILSVFSEERRECVSVLMVSFVVDEVKAQTEILTSYRAYFFCKLGILFKKSFKLDKRGFCDGVLGGNVPLRCVSYD